MDTLYFAPPVFLIIAFVFSMLGMGGSQLYIPLLFWLGMDFKTQAIPLGILLNVASSMSATVTYARTRLIDWRIAIAFGASVVVFAPLGAWINTGLRPKLIILVFALFTAAAAALMLSGWKPERPALSARRRVLLGVAAGTVLGFFAGLLGRGGGAFVVPLLYIMGLDPKSAAATSSLIVTFSGSSSLCSHLLMAAKADWLMWTLCLLSVVVGSQIGSRFMARKAKPRSVKLVFGLVLLGVAMLLIVKDVLMK